MLRSATQWSKKPRSSCYPAALSLMPLITSTRCLACATRFTPKEQAWHPGEALDHLQANPARDHPNNRSL